MLLERIIGHADDRPDSIAIVDDRRTYTYREFAWGGHVMTNHIERLAPPVDEGGDKIGLLLPQSGAFAIAFMACRWLNRIPIPLNYLLRPKELAAVIQDSGMKLIFAIKPFEALVNSISAELEQFGVKVVYMETLTFEPPTFLQKAQAVLSNPLSPFTALLRPIPKRDPDDLGLILYTSGTSGVPKGVMLTNRNLESNAKDAMIHARFTERTVFLGVLPLFHTFGLMATGFVPFALGCKVIYRARFSAPAVFEAIEQHQAECIFAVPTMYSVLLNSKSGKPDSLQSVKLAISGGEPLPVTLIHDFREKFGVTLMEGFGLTETSPIVAISMPWANKPGSVGKVIPDVQVKTVDEQGNELPRGADGGELWIKGPNVMKGYYKKPDLTAEVLTEPEADGLPWFKTGDIARIDEDGYLFITGRKKDMIIMAGEKVFPREIEDVIRQHPAVAHNAVIGAKDPTRGEMPVAFIQLHEEYQKGEKPAPTANDIRNFVREHIAPYKAPKEVYFLNEMPKTPTGKILKRDLVELLPKAAE